MANDEYIVREGRVVSTEDDKAGNRIKVRLGGLDGTLSDDELPYCFPLLPKLLHVYPKVGESVLVILQLMNASESNRFYIGPILSQYNTYRKDLANVSATNMLKDALTKPYPNPNTDPQNDGTLPDREDVAILGRYNCDVILKEEELHLRCGIKSQPDAPRARNLHFNNIDPAYIQLKYKKIKDSQNREINSVINVVADRINLLSRDSGNVYNLYDKLLSDKKDNDGNGYEDEMKKILDTAHPLVYGDNLVNFLKKLIEIFRTHSHSFAYNKPDLSEQEIEILNTNLDGFLSESVRTS